MTLWHDKKIHRYMFYLVLLLMSMGFIYLIRNLFVSFILAAVLVYLLYPLVCAMEERGTPRVLAILLAYMGVMIVVSAILLYGIPRLVNQLHTLVYMLPSYTDQVEIFLQNVQKSYYRTELPEAMRQAIDQQISEIESTLQQLLVATVRSIISLLGHSLNFILAPVLAFYILKDLDSFKSKVTVWLPERHFSDTWHLARQINVVLISFIRGHLSLVIIVGLMTGISMALLGLEYSVMLGIIAGLTELIPYFGPILGAIPAVAIGLMQSKYMAIKVVLAILIIQQIEGNILAPKVLGQSVGLHPLFIIMVLLAGAELYGVVGMLLAVPVAAILRILLSFLYQKIVLQNLP
ncbi:AI-2E family transporter [Peptococcaceae bacterium 1198_IL3148]